jgi:co-chaperonin GroES (HSP10)
MAFRPLGDLIVVIPDPVSDKTTGGIIVSKPTVPYQTGTVIAVNGGRRDATGTTPCFIKVGSKIAYGNKIQTIEILPNDLNMTIDKKLVKNAVMIHEPDVLAILIDGID